MESSVLLDTFERQLIIQLTDAEVNERAQEAADRQAERDRIEEERKAAQSQMSGQVKALDSIVRDKLRQVRLRQDNADVAVEKRLDPARRVIFEIRTDTGEQIKERAAREDEMQVHLLPHRPNDEKASGDD